LLFLACGFKGSYLLGLLRLIIEQGSKIKFYPFIFKFFMLFFLLFFNLDFVATVYKKGFY